MTGTNKHQAAGTNKWRQIFSHTQYKTEIHCQGILWVGRKIYQGLLNTRYHLWCRKSLSHRSLEPENCEGGRHNKIKWLYRWLFFHSHLLQPLSKSRCSLIQKTGPLSEQLKTSLCHYIWGKLKSFVSCIIMHFPFLHIYTHIHMHMYLCLYIDVHIPAKVIAMVFFGSRDPFSSK